MEMAHEEEYAGHPILRLFTRPEEMECGPYMNMAKEDIRHMNGEGGKKLTYETLQNGDPENIGDYIWSVARSRLDGDPQRKKEGSDDITSKNWGKIESDGQNASNRTRSPKWQTRRL
eukprot:6214177-Pleurochrysis_carterae.AAC.5